MRRADTAVDISGALYLSAVLSGSVRYAASNWTVVPGIASFYASSNEFAALQKCANPAATRCFESIPHMNET
jgi:hypothetical protein